MFDKDTYIRRRAELKKLVGKGIVVLFGNNEAPANYPANSYSPMRQDSTFLYYFGQHREGLVGIINIDNEEEWLLGNDIDVEDIVWMGYTPSVSELAQQVGVTKTAPLSALKAVVDSATSNNAPVHFLPPYRYDTMILIMDLLGIHPSEQKQKASLSLIKAVVKMRSVKEQQEIEAIERACDIGYEMHTTAQRLIRPGITERFVGGQVDGVARSLAQGVSFATIFSQHGEIMHGSPSDSLLADGRLALCDAGCELDDYCSDHTRTMPVNGHFTQRQLEIYSIVESCHDYVLEVAKPGVKYADVHFAVCRLMTEKLKELGLMKGDPAEAAEIGAYALFFPCGLGHMVGLDVHNMENLGEQYVGYADGQVKSTQFGFKSLRLARPLEPGFVFTVEPGIYFIPELMDKWQAEHQFEDFICYDKLSPWRDFTGLRNELNYVMTPTGARLLGKLKKPMTIEEVYQAKNN